MGRLYIAAIDIAAATTNRDIFSLRITGGGNPPVALHEFLVTTDIETDANEEQIELEFSRRTGAWTNGSGGSSVNGYPILQADTADSLTVRTGDTTKATGGTQQVFSNIFVNNRAGVHIIFTPESRPNIRSDGTSEHGLILTMQATTTASTAFGGHIVYEELI